MRYIENLESVNKKMIIDENGLKITQDAILLSEFIKKYFNTKYKNKEKKTILEIGAGQGIITLLLSKIEIFEKMLNKNFENWNIKQSHKNLGNVLQFSRKIKIRGKEYNPKISIINFEKIYSTLFLKKNINFHNLVHFLKDKRMLRLLNSNQLEIYMGNSAEEFEIAFIKNGKKNIPVKISFKNLYPKNYKKICSSIFKIREIEYENIGIFYGIFKYVCIVWPFLFIGSLMTKKNLFLITSTGILLLVSFVIRVMSYYSASNKILKIKTIDKK